MANIPEQSELQKFYQAIQLDIRSQQLTEEDGGNLEQFFTQWAVDLLADGGETENVRVAYDEKALGTKNQHKINAYSISDNYETIDLFITLFKGTEEPIRIAKDEIDTASKRIANFFRKGVYKDYVTEIEESSPIFDFAFALSNTQELKDNLVRINAIILTDSLYPGEVPGGQTISGYPFTYRIVDLNYLYNIAEKSHVAIEIDFAADGFNVPCIVSPSENDQYQSYLAIISGTALATIYERYGSRLLEQNVRSFLQFTGKINKGIRTTILKEPHMFLAFNNGIAATAEEINIKSNGKGLCISSVKDFQIVNGGQTTASIYHTFKKDKADIQNIFVQLKLSVVKEREKFSEVVSRISEYANTQNKVSVSDLSSNRPFHIELEKLSRSIYTPHVPGQTTQTRWFYERARGQYKNARLKEGFTKAKQKAFDLKNPKSQMFTKEELAKYVNAYAEVAEGKKILIGPHYVVRGNQKNYVQFINSNIEKKIDNVYYEDVIAKAILFRAAVRMYNANTDLQRASAYIYVPYSLSYLTHVTKNRLNLYKIWKNQALSDELKEVIADLSIKVHDHIYNKSLSLNKRPDEWAKKEECWTDLKNQHFTIDLKNLKMDLEDPANPTVRRKLSDEDTVQVRTKEELEIIRSVPPMIWQQIEEWGRTSKELSDQQMNVAFNLSSRVRTGSRTLLTLR
ncbi:MAG: hypothetical protein EOP48_05075 [Sphingobacteriales bacterium]|nr:MAG: hypothetical protein EOP48_05075 [Sphingobacteriales bacterium]